MALLRFLAFAGFALVGPGLNAQLWARVRPDPALIVPLGTAFVAFAYFLALVTGQLMIFPLLVLSSYVIWFWRRPGSLRLPRTLVPPCVALVCLLAVTQFPWNRPASDGRFLLDPFVAFDTAFHVGLTRELTLGFPPQVPGMAGFPLGYHLGTDLVRAAGLRFAAIDPYDGIARFDVTLWAVGLALALAAAARALSLPPLAVVLAPWTLLATDFSYLFAANSQAHWWSDLLRGNLLISLALANPVIPGLCLTLGCLIALGHHEADRGRGFFWLAVVQAMAVPFFKVFLGAHLFVGLMAAAVLRRRLSPAWVAGAVLLPTVILALGTGARSVEIAVAPLDLVSVTRESLGLSPLHGLPLVGWALLWIGASLGIRLLGLPLAMRAAWRSPSTVATTLATMALAAWPGGLLFRISAPDAVAGQRPVNDAAYLVEQGGPLLWLFTVAALASLAPRLRVRWVVGAAALLSLPSTAQFIVKKASLPPDPIPAATMRAMQALEAVTTPGAVVLQRPGARYPPAPVVFIGRRVPYERFTPYLTQFAPRPELEARHATVHRFFQTEDPAEARAIAGALGAGHLCLYGTDRVRFPPDDLLDVVYDEPGARVFRIR